METYQIKNLAFRYPGRNKNALGNITLSIRQGEFIVLCGKSGCGKSTLLRQLKPAMTPYGQSAGTIFFEGKNIKELDLKEQTQKIGFVLQNPDSQIVTDKVWHELAFGLESLGCKNEEIRLKVSEMASFFGIAEWFHKSTSELSGGQKQILNLASVMAMQPSALILDEPTSQLDPIASMEFIHAVYRINQEFGTTVILSEHNLEEVMPLADRVIMMENGTVFSDAPPSETGKYLMNSNNEMFYAMPAPVRIHTAIHSCLPCPLTVKDGRNWLKQVTTEITPEKIKIEKSVSLHNTPAIEIRDLWFRYTKDAPEIIKGLNLSIEEKSIYAIVGGNGSGKSTTLSLLCGVSEKQRGSIKIKNIPIEKLAKNRTQIIAMLPQNPQTLFVKNTVHQDLYEMFQGKNFSKAEQEEKIKNIISLCELQDLLNYHPYDLSGGEQQRAALAKLLLLDPEILLLDEPTKGLDNFFKMKLAEMLKKLTGLGKTIVLVSHDIEFCAQYTDRCAMFFDGCITAEADSRSFFIQNSFYTTSAARMARNIIPGAVTSQDIIYALNPSYTSKSDFKPQQQKSTNPKNDPLADTLMTANNNIELMEVKKLPKHTVLASLLILLLIPLTIYLGITYLNDRKYFFISMLVLLETLLPFLLIFEGRKLTARELVILACICASAVAGRLAFFMIPQFKPVIALIIIGGVCFGAESGFLIGSVTGFISNFFFGQGPWTPWQMFGYGVIGFAAGILFRKGFLKKSTKSLCIFGFIATFCIYGIIMNTYHVFSFQDYPTFEMIMIAIIQGLPFDLVHSISTVVFLILLAKPMIEKFERIKIKYGLIYKQ